MQLNQATVKNLVLKSRTVVVILSYLYFTYTSCQMGMRKKDYEDQGKSGSGKASLAEAAYFYIDATVESISALTEQTTISWTFVRLI